VGPIQDSDKPSAATSWLAKSSPSFAAHFREAIIERIMNAIPELSGL
jgi:hypothetical protein